MTITLMQPPRLRVDHGNQWVHTTTYHREWHSLPWRWMDPTLQLFVLCQLQGVRYQAIVADWIQEIILNILLDIVPIPTIPIYPQCPIHPIHPMPSTNPLHSAWPSPIYPLRPNPWTWKHLRAMVSYQGCNPVNPYPPIWSSIHSLSVVPNLNHPLNHNVISVQPVWSWAVLQGHHDCHRVYQAYRVIRFLCDVQMCRIQQIR